MKFQLKNVGKIKDAEFELKPLTVFIGANGSGKTYAASALWGVANFLTLSISAAEIFRPKNILSEKEYSEFSEKILYAIEELTNKKQTELSLNKKQIESLITKNVQSLISNQLKAILTETFGYDNFEQSVLQLKLDTLNQYKISLFWGAWDIDTQQAKLQKEIGKEKRLTICFKKGNKTRINTHTSFSYQENENINAQHIIDSVFIGLIVDTYFMYQNFHASEFIYIPAARTGLMFITHTVVQNQLYRANNFFFHSQHHDTNDLTAPLNDFIKRIHNVSRPRSEKQPENSYFNKIMNGKLVQREGQYRLDYQPNGLDKILPLAASSSLVTELAALAALENEIKIGSFVILEEPEAHLHLSAQRDVAKLIVRLINEKKCRILLTTHSDTFLQQINNLIMLEKLSYHNENALADFGIQAAEVIAADDVAVYDFQCVNNETRVENLVCGEYGFVAKSMNDVLIALADETQAIIGQIDDLED